MIYPPLPERHYTPIFPDEQLKIKECREQIDNIIGDHRDPNNDFFIKMCELDKYKKTMLALDNIIKIKMDLYIATGVKL